MKAAVTIAGENAKASAYVVWRGIEQSICKAAAMGYDGVEIALKDESEIDRRSLSRWLKENQMEVSCITTGQVFAERGLYFTHQDPAKRRETIEVFSGLIDLAQEFGGLVNAGRARGFVAPGQDKEETEKIFIDTMQTLCDKAEAKQVQLIIEPVNRYEINFINNLDEGAELIERVHRRNCGLHADVFHMNIEDDDIGKSLIRNGKWVRYVHLADSNRLAPGLGHLNFKEVFDALDRIAYDGWVSAEILPGKTPDRMASQAIQYLRPMISDYNRKSDRRRVL